MPKRDGRPAEPIAALTPQWPAPARVRACTTCRGGGWSRSPYHGLNLAAHVGDDPDAVAANRRRARQALGLPAEPVWLTQVHGTAVIDAAAAGYEPVADGAYTTRPGVVCAVLTADCLPVLLCSPAGDTVAAVHVGWRGLAAGVLGTAVTAMGAARPLAWLGPAIGGRAYQVGGDVMELLSGAVEDPPPGAIRRDGRGRWLVDLYRLAGCALGRLGVGAVFGGGWCTYSDAERFYSYRRDGVTGRMASMIWLEEPHSPAQRNG